MTTSRFAEIKLSSIHETKVLTMSSGEQERSEKEQLQLQISQKGNYRPRRAFTSHDYRLPLPMVPSTSSSRLQSPAVTPNPSSKLADFDSYFQLPISSSTAVSASACRSSIPPSPTDSSTSSQNSFEVSLSVPPGHVPPHRRPFLPPPQRSYSVMDYVPIPVLHLPGEKLQIVHLPPEIHFAIFDFLDPIDSTCLGLTNKHLYAIHKRMHGTIPLSARREGPNDMEWAWRGAGPLIDATLGKDKENAQQKALRPRGQV